MTQQSVYIETSVISYLTARPSRNITDLSRQQITCEWWENILPHFDPFVSPIVLEEASKGDPSAAALRLERISQFQVLEITKAVRTLAESYFSRIHLPEKARADAYHLATATFHGMDFLISWNCKHIVNAHIRRMLEELNADQGIRTPIICTPEELTEA